MDVNQEFELEPKKLDSLGFPVALVQNAHCEQHMVASQNVEQSELDSLGFPVALVQNPNDDQRMVESQNKEMEQLRTALQIEASCEQLSLQRYAEEVSNLTQELLIQKESNLHLQNHIIHLEQKSLKSDVHDEMEHLSIALQWEKEKSGCQQVALQSYADEVSVLTQELLFQKEINLQLQNHIFNIEQENLKVNDELKMFQSRIQFLEKIYEGRSAELKVSKQRNEELEQKLKALKAHQQKNKFLHDQYKQEKNDEEIMKLLKDLTNSQELLFSKNQELLCQKQHNLKLNSQIKHMEQERLKVADEMKVAQSRIELLEKRDDDRTTELKLSDQRNKELEQQLMALSSQMQNEQKLQIFQKKQQEFTSLRAHISELENELEMHKVQWEEKSFFLNEHQEELASIRARMAVMDEEIKDLKQVMVTTRELQKTQEHQMDQEDTNMADEQITLGTQEDKGQVCHGVIEKLQLELSCSQKKCDRLQTELIQTLNKLGTQRSKFYNKELRYKDKLSKAKATYLKETAWRDGKLNKQKDELRLVTFQLEKKNEMFLFVVNENEKLLQNNLKMN